ncbi:hypothetical protein HPB47_004429 [Ixodes persulcatus]|uniref:Uncharacterized protein n=1 Tax=Ixodes persulcatus TaxID=34615 RepID=A0AC60PGX7_IXOPE|nr:hypothetical protein HPB47_004429 [Ixodes persulcatus]
MIKTAAEQTNTYSHQKCGTSITVSEKEVEQVIGMYLHMGLMDAPSVRCYWESELRYCNIADGMSRNRFEAIVGNLQQFGSHRTTEERQSLENMTMYSSSE